MLENNWHQRISILLLHLVWFLSSSSDPLCNICGRAGGSQLVQCIACNCQIHTEKCSVAEAAEGGISTGKRMCTDCYCIECRIVKEQDHVCTCKCCGSRPFDKRQCHSCLYYVCSNTCCAKTPLGSDLCSDCVAAGAFLFVHIEGLPFWIRILWLIH